MNPYPTASDLRREAAATTRDLGNLLALRQLRLIVVNAIERAGMLEELQHPWIGYRGAPDLIAVLDDQLVDIDGAAAKLRRETALED